MLAKMTVFSHVLDKSCDITVVGPKKLEDTRPDQWQCQILLRVLRHARVIFVSALPPELVRAFHMVPASSLEEAMILARRYAGSQLPTVAAIPDGVGTILR